MNNTFDKIVNKLGKGKDNIVTSNEIRQWIQRIQGDTTGTYKMIQRLTTSGHISPIRNGLYMIGGSTHDWGEYYWEIVKKLVKLHTYNEGIIGGHTSASLHLGDQSLPEKLTILTRNTNKIVTISDSYKIHFRTIKQKNGKNIFPKIWSTRCKTTIQSTDLHLLNKEISLLELLTVRSDSVQDADVTVRKFLRRYQKNIDITIIEDIVEIKYITALNRLREYAKSEKYEGLYRQTLQIIQKSGKGCFLSIKL